jgi:hypothetical protein
VSKEEHSRPLLNIPGSLIEKSTTEQQGSICLIAMPNTSMKRPATNIDQMMSYIEEGHSRRIKDVTIVSDCTPIDVIFNKRIPVAVQGGKFEKKWVQLQENGKLIVFNQDPKGDDFIQENIQ